jgi:hypothetical protein
MSYNIILNYINCILIVTTKEELLVLGIKASSHYIRHIAFIVRQVAAIIRQVAVI